MERKLKTAIKGLALLMAFGATSHAAQSLPGVAAQPASYFYTGKPYDADLNAYKFTNRDYNPEVNRWTSIDPSGFPDGPNNSVYVRNAPSFTFDDLGLTSKSIAWLYWSGSFGPGIFQDLQSNIESTRKLMTTADAAPGSETHYLDDGDSFGKLLLATSVEDILTALGQYKRIVLFSHGGYINNQYIWGKATSPYHLSSEFGSNANRIYYGTCYDAYSPNPVTGSQSEVPVSTIITGAKKVTTDYLRE